MIESKVGSLNRRWASILSKHVKKLFGVSVPSAHSRRGGTGGAMPPVKGLTPKKCLQSRMMVDKLARHDRGPNGGHGRPPLSMFSEWLHDFDGTERSASTGLHIDMPGWVGKGGSQFAPRIESFDSKLLTMDSKQKPKRIKIRGSDEREYYFLVKGGEDLRLDQRIEQMFEVLNGIFDRDGSCCQRGLRVKTYGVIPMTSQVGLIEWVQNTEPLKNIYEAELMRRRAQEISGRGRGRAKPKPIDVMRMPASAHRQKWLSKVGKSQGADGYVKLYERANARDASRVFSECAEMVPRDLLRMRLLDMSSGPEAFFSIRSQFARSLSAFSAASYILGIGDRHLGNFLIDQTDGTVVGIDFGLAFGCGLGLPVPELIPFRMTRQFLGIFEPMDSSRLLSLSLMHAMRASRAEMATLVSVLQVFIKEPLLDWTKDANAPDPDYGVDEAGNECAWFPNLKISMVKRKLRGANPASVMSEEFDQECHRLCSKAKPKIREAIWGDRSSQRRQLRDAGVESLDAQQQVNCLVEMATDPAILARQWIGLVPWI